MFLRTCLALLVALALPMLARAEESPWVIDAATARERLATGALLLDTRSTFQRLTAPIDGAVPVDWQDFSQSGAQKGLLRADDAGLTAELQALGLHKGQAVVVVAATGDSWGQDARMVWTLRALGQAGAQMVSGGADALLAAGPLTVAPVTQGNAVVARTEAYSIRREALAAELAAPGLVILDAREPREYAGATPYGESRGGHVPGAKLLFFRDLMAEDGTALQGSALAARLKALGVGKDTRVVTYCSGGVRSSFVTAVLRSAGVDAVNYPGSMWDWSAAPAADYPLVTE